MKKSQTNNYNQSKRGSVKWPVIATIFVVLSIAIGFLCYLNRTIITDWFLSFNYHPTTDVINVQNSLMLTPRGDLMFAATNPSLENRDDFNEDCKSHNQDISILGCYGKGRIYIYDIKSDELPGVIESTAAHELLHAAWARMGNNEKNTIVDVLMEVYNNEKYHAELAEDLETYGDHERIEELHSRIGTQIADLPETLEKHYAKIFKDQDYIVSFYDSYITPFKELEAEIDALSSELEKLGAEIEQKTSDYTKAAEELSGQIDEFNRCASTPNCFATDAGFYARRSQLVAKQSALEDVYGELSDLVDHYNTLVAEYNDNIIRGEALENAMNSNKETDKLN
ncbi:hypothetical protein IKD60_00285 [Candidatus Saccharibacteria bacterium]|nr:hypothetical protein [Candidatus Saccharibacteria bacterium]